MLFKIQGASCEMIETAALSNANELAQAACVYVGRMSLASQSSPIDDRAKPFEKGMKQIPIFAHILHVGDEFLCWMLNTGLRLI